MNGIILTFGGGAINGFIVGAVQNHCPDKLMGHVALGAALQPLVQIIDMICQNSALS